MRWEGLGLLGPAPRLLNMPPCACVHVRTHFSCLRESLKAGGAYVIQVLRREAAAELKKREAIAKRLKAKSTEDNSATASQSPSSFAYSPPTPPASAHDDL